MVGNSLGGYTALATAAFHPELVHACAVLNGAGEWSINQSINQWVYVVVCWCWCCGC